MKKVIIFFLFVFLSIISIEVLLVYNSNNEIEKYKRKLNTQKEIIKYLEMQRDTLQTALDVSYDSVYRFEIILGVKEPDSKLEYKEKLLATPKAIQRLNHYKFK